MLKAISGLGGMGLGLGLDGPLNASLLRAPLCGANNDDDTSDHNEDDGEDVGDDDSDNDNDDDGEDGGLFSATSRRMNHKTASLLTTQVEYIIISSITFVIITIIILVIQGGFLTAPLKSSKYKKVNLGLVRCI